MDQVLAPEFLKTVGSAFASFRKEIETAYSPPKEIEDLCFRAKVFDHCSGLEEEFIAAGVSSSGKFPILRQNNTRMACGSRTCRLRPKAPRTIPVRT